MFEAISSVAPGTPPFNISLSGKDAHDERSYKHLVNLAAELGRIHTVVGKEPPLSLIRGEKWSFQWEMKLLIVIQSLQAALDELKRAEHSLARELGLLSDPRLETGRRDRLKALAPRLEPGALNLSSVPDDPAHRLARFADSLATDVKRLLAAGSEAMGTYSFDAVRRMPFEQLDEGWRKAQVKFWPASFFARRKIRKHLQTWAENGATDPAMDLKALFEMRARDTAIRDNPLTPIA